MVPDPNWLLSTAGQSSAAIVAIVGGFISIRLLGLASDKSSLRSRLTEKQEQISRLNEELTKAVREFEEYRVNTFLNRIISELRDQEDLPSVEDIAKRHTGDPLDDNMLRELYENLKGHILRAREWIASLDDLVEDGSSDFDEWVREHGLDITNIDQEEAEVVFHRERTKREEKKREALRKSGITLANILASGLGGLSISPLSAEWRVYEAQRQYEEYKELRQRVESLSFQVRIDQGECDDLEQQLKHFQYPTRLWIPLTILLYLVAVGIIFPLSLMPAISLGKLSWNVIVWGISVGILALVTYFVVEFFKLRRQ